MSVPWVAVQAKDITDRWRPLTDAEQDITPTLIQDAQDLLELTALRAGINKPAGFDPRWERTYRRIVTTMVRRVLRNPDGYLSERIDDWEYRRGDAESTGELFVSDAERDELKPPTPLRRGGAFSITPHY